MTKTINYTGISGSRVAYFAAKKSAENKSTLIVVSSAAVAERLREDLAFFASAEIVVLPEEDDLRFAYEARDPEHLIRWIKAEEILLSGNGGIVIAPVSAALRKVPDPARFAGSCITLSVGDIIDPADLKRSLVKAGYVAGEVVDTYGEFSSRGGITDVFPPNCNDPVRIEFFDDEIDSIRLYDKDSQRSIENVRTVTLSPAALFVPEDEEIEAAVPRIEKELDKRTAEIVRERMNTDIYADLTEFFDIPVCRTWEITFEETVMLVDPKRLRETITDDSERDAFTGVYSRNCIIFTPFPEAIEGVERLDEVINVTSHEIASYNGQIRLLSADVASYSRSGFDIHIVMTDEGRRDRIREYLDDEGHSGKVTYEIGSLGNGFVLNDEKLCYITERDLFPDIKRHPVKRRAKRPAGIDFSDLEKGDYVVHELHGIGRFEGMQVMEADGETRDYLKIRYAGTDVLYIPTDQMDIVQKYIGNEGRAPKLSSLSGTGWRKARARARKAAMTIAEDLVKLYAEREAAGGHAFSEDTVWQTEFEEEFPYTETEDQLKAVEEIKADMQKPLPMDRLLCGDVGYGKTEVAARAIFKCISEGKQAALLAPTTLLANQHYNTLKDRYARFPFVVEMLSRFKTDSEQDEIIRGLASGNVDLIIGTHRLLSDDVKFKDIGLLVIDEEQRFGVRHKEKIKMMRKSVDVLTLSATPIPRTLNMSLTGIKDISMIVEPPENRYPVQTFVTPQDEGLIRSVIERELSRDGQVFVVNNRVKGIEDIAAMIRELVPAARIGIGHGQMSEVTLENVMMDFIEKRIDVLVATTIIENGIDIPNANTMIVLNADMLGLAQLYQLRGRVGRSDRIAYAYLMYQPQKVMTELAHKRLIAIRDFTEFGAGFKLAMKDLELRGAGNVLGEAQHGHIDGVGYELYCKEIDRAVKRLRGEHVTESKSDVAVDIRVPARIPAEYISNETLRLQAYKKIVSVDSEEASDDLISELIDRYGDIPEITLDLIKVSETRGHAEKLGIGSIQEKGDKIYIKPGSGSKINAYVLVMTKGDIGDRLTITGGSSPQLVLYTGNGKPIDLLLDVMRSLERNSEDAAKAV